MILVLRTLTFLPPTTHKLSLPLPATNNVVDSTALDLSVREPATLVLASLSQ